MTTLGGEYRDNRLRVFGRKIKIPKEETMLLVFDFFFFLQSSLKKLTITFHL